MLNQVVFGESIDLKIGLLEPNLQSSVRSFHAFLNFVVFSLQKLVFGQVLLL